MKMYRKLAILILCLFLFASAAFGESNAETAWYELSDDECVITLRLPVVNDDGWTFEISEPRTIELLTMETLGDEPDEDVPDKLWVASFRATGEQFGNATIECTNASVGTYSIDLFAVENGQIQIVDTCSPEDIDNAYVLAAGSADIRREPDAQSESIGTVPEDAQLGWCGKTALDERGMIWFEVEWNQNESGWVSAEDGKLMNMDLIVEFTGDQVNVRNQPGLDGEIVDVFPRGTAALYLNACEVDERGVAWYSIRTNGGPCWVSSKYAKIR